MAFGEIKIRSYNGLIDRARMEDLERRCEVGPSQHVFLFTDTMGDPICRIRSSPMYTMLVAELNNELVGAIQGSIKVVTIHITPKDLAKVGYILGLRVSPLHRRKGYGSKLVQHLEEWFQSNQVDYTYMATEKDNEASSNLFINKFHYIKFRTPTILVHPVDNRSFHVPSNIEIAKLEEERAEFLYRKFMGSTTEFFPVDIDMILENKLSLGTWVSYYKDACQVEFGIDGRVPENWAMLSVWNSGGLFKLRIGKVPFCCLFCAKSSSFMEKVFPWLKVPVIPDFLDSFGFYFMYGLHQEGPSSGKLVRALCKYVYSMAKKDKNCKVVVTEVGKMDRVRVHIPHLKLLSCPEDLWCIKALKNEDEERVNELTRNPPTRPLFVDPREV